MDEPIRILNLFTIMDRGGAETMVMNYYRNIDRTKIQFDFMVHREQSGAYDDEIRALGGRIFHMPPVRPWSEIAYRKMIRAFFIGHPEYTILHAHMSELAYYAFSEAKKLGIPVRICHAHNSRCMINKQTVIRLYYRNRIRKYLTHKFTCGEDAGKWLFGTKDTSDFVMMNNAIDAEKYIYDMESYHQIRRQLGIDSKLVIGHVGRFAYQKNHTFLIDIFSEVLKNNNDAVLLLIGDDNGKFGAEIHNKVQELNLEKHVIFLGLRSDVIDLLKAMDVFVFPSLYEGLSVVSIEVQASGLPILISDKVPIECKKTDLVKIVSLNNSAEKWADEVISASKLPRRNTYEEIVNAGFDIKENAKWLQELYFKLSDQTGNFK